MAIENAGDELAVLAVFGRMRRTASGWTPIAGAARSEDGTILAVDPRLAELGVRVVLPPAGVDGVHRRAWPDACPGSRPTTGIGSHWACPTAAAI